VRHLHAFGFVLLIAIASAGAVFASPQNPSTLRPQTAPYQAKLPTQGGSQTGANLPANTTAQQNTQAQANSAAPVPAPQPGAGITAVIIDPAHGGPDTGARGPDGAEESEIVLDFARAIRVALEAQGLRVILTREGNQDPSFDNRSTIANGLRGAIFISLHVASGGPAGTARAYSYSFNTSSNSLAAPSTGLPGASPPPSLQATPVTGRPITGHAGLIEWDRAQEPYADLSRRLAELVQIQLAQKFAGSPDVPQTAPVRQLRTIAAPAIAIELSSIDAAGSQRLAPMAQPLAEAVARAVADFKPVASAALARTGGK